MTPFSLACSHGNMHRYNVHTHRDRQVGEKRLPQGHTHTNLSSLAVFRRASVSGGGGWRADEGCWTRIDSYCDSYCATLHHRPLHVSTAGS